jgi:hypothetical protein
MQAVFLHVRQGEKRTLGSEQILHSLMLDTMPLKLKETQALQSLSQSLQLAFTHLPVASQRSGIQYRSLSPLRKRCFSLLDHRLVSKSKFAAQGPSPAPC